MDILTGSNQVINPEYVTPLESKESPLSLLAKTCSNIGLDQPARPAPAAKSPKEEAKPASPASSASSTSSRTSEPRPAARRSPPGSRSKVSFKPYESVTSTAEERTKARSPARKGAASPRAAAAAAAASSPSPSPTAKESPKPAGAYLAPYGLGSPLDALYLRAGLPPAACRDPLCKGCLPGLCPAGCPHCKALPPPAALGLGLYPPPGLVGGLQPYCCNWSEAGAYCGKRFNSSDELMQHLRGHTSPAADAPLLPSLQQLMTLPRAPYPGAPLAPARFHPYAKPAPPLPAPASLALYPYLAHPYLYAGLRR